MRRPLFIVCLCLVMIIGIDLLWYDFDDSGGIYNEIPLADKETITVTGRVCQKTTQSFTLEQSEISYVADSRQIIPIQEKIICEYETNKDILLGSTVTLQGTFFHFAEATNPGEFNAKEYYDTQEILGKVTNVRLISRSENYSAMNEILYQLRCYFKNRLYEIFPEKEASVMTAMLLGDKEDLNKDIKELYKKNGIIHILSISGLHITMIGMSIYKMLRRAGMPIWMAALIGAVILCLYGMMTGMSVSACRAIGMYLIRMLAEIVGRSYDMLTALGVLAAVMVLKTPANLRNVGFLLSFGSVLGIGVLCPALLPEEKVIPRRYEPIVRRRVLERLWKASLKRLKESIIASASIGLTTLPIQLWFYYEISVYSTFVNLLILPWMSLLMMTGLVAMILPGSGSIGTVAYHILLAYEGVCQWFEHLPFHTWNPGKPDGWQVVIYYFILVSIILLKRQMIKKRKERKGRLYHMMKHAAIFIALTAAVIILALRVRACDRVTFLDVGQGDCVVVELKTGEVYLFDCGSTGRDQVGQYVLLPYLKYQGIGRIDGVFVSHGDEDHCNGIWELLEFKEEENIQVEQLVLPLIGEEIRDEELGDFGQETGVTVSYVGAGDCFRTKTASFLCLHPPREYLAEDSNTYSQCFYVEMENFSLLLTGDIQGDGEALLLQEIKERMISDVTVLKVAHHGSRNSTPEELLSEITPQLAVISCGKNNSYGHPHKETLERLEEAGSIVFSTSKFGAITIEAEEKNRIFLNKYK